VTQIAMMASDLTLTAGALINDAAGGPEGLSRGLRWARAYARSLDALKTCASLAASGTTPPVSENEWRRLAVDTGSSVTGMVRYELKRRKIGPKLPTPLTLKLNSAAPGVVGTLSATGKAYAMSIKANPLTAGADVVSLMTAFDNANHSWTPGEFWGCLAAKAGGTQ
jgi:hypothetical protein